MRTVSSNFIRVVLVSFTIALAACSGEVKDKAGAEKIPILTFSEFKPLLEPAEDSVYVVNFWASWCAPCVKEIPYLERIAQENTNRNVKVLLVNLDFPNHFESRVVPFVDEHIQHSEVVMLNDPDANSWIPQVHPDWTGALPTTLVFSTSNQVFIEGEVTYQMLSDALAEFDIQ